MTKKLLSIVEQGGYESFHQLYAEKGFIVSEHYVMRNALKWLKRNDACVIVTEFNFQSDFRDRSSSLESLLASLQWLSDTKVIVLYDKEWQGKLNVLCENHDIYETLSFPVSKDKMEKILDEVLANITPLSQL